MVRIDSKTLLIFLGILVAGIAISGCSQSEDTNQQTTETGSTGETNVEVEHSTGTSSTGSSSDWCNSGSTTNVNTAEGSSNVKIIGFENQVIEGTELKLCCGEVEVTAEGVSHKEKVCFDENAKHSVSYQYDNQKGEYIKVMVTYLKDGKQCSKLFDEDGNVLAEMCEGEIPNMEDGEDMPEMPTE